MLIEGNKLKRVIAGKKPIFWNSFLKYVIIKIEVLFRETGPKKRVDECFS